ncbi:MAG: PilZ domain-containing protein [Candidatus Omnitrophota bacterium]|jgi:hypothetical protein
MITKTTSQRLFDRLEVRFPARLKKENLAEDQDIIVKDFSPEGVKILTTKELSLFDRFSLSFSPSHDLTYSSMPGHIVWTGQESSGAWHAGFKFEKVDLLKANRIIELCQ